MEEIKNIMKRYAGIAEAIPSVGIILSEDMRVMFSNKKGIDLLISMGNPYQNGLTLFEQIPEFGENNPDFDLAKVKEEYAVEDWYNNKKLYLRFYFKKTKVDGVLLPVLFIIDKTESRQNKEEAEGVLESYKKLLSILGHDFMSPLNSMIGFLELSMEDETLEYQSMILKSANSIFEQLSQVLALSKKDYKSISKIEKKQLFLSKIVDDAIGLNTPVALNQEISLNNGVLKNVELVSNKTILISVISNLINNAIKFSHKRGRVYLLSRRRDNNIEILIKDSGIGMSPKEVELLFSMKRFSKVGNNHQLGNGVGMINTKSSIEELGGSISVSSTKGNGSVFTITLPLE